MNIKIDRIIYDPVKTEEKKEFLLNKLETSEELSLLFQRKEKLDAILKVFRILSDAFMIFWCLILILSTLDIFELNDRVGLALLLIGLVLILLTIKCLKAARKAHAAYINNLHEETIALRFHECCHNNKILACYITSANDDDCRVRVIAEAAESEIIEQNFHFAISSSADTNDIILDIENKCVKYPKWLCINPKEN